MSNQETEPRELVCEAEATTAKEDVEVIEPREVPLGGPRALTVRRTLPHRRRSFVGGWCFCDHYGPDPVTRPGQMDVPPHPHTGLQTVSWLFQGEIEHRDSVGSHAFIHPGQVNLMTAGSGIQHSEVSTEATTELHGVQLWVALPGKDRETAPFFEHDTPEAVTMGAARLQVFVGSLLGSESAVTTFSPLLGAQLDIPAGESVVLPADPAFEYGLLVDAGRATLAGVIVPKDHLGYLRPGRSEFTVAASDAPLRAILLGGVPLGEQIVMWWNFIGRDHDEIVAFRAQWQQEVVADTTPDGRFGSLGGHPFGPLPAPELPKVRLRPHK